MLLAAVLFAAPMFANSIYWYNGDSGGGGNIADERGGAFGNSFIYDDFNVGAAGVDITGLIATEAIDNAAGITQASWEIRSGVSSGNGGTLVASGTNNISLVDTGAALGGEIYNVTLNGINVNLGAGTYWLAIAPVLPGNQRAWIQTTTGVNAVGSPQGNNGNSFANGPALGANFTPISVYFGSSFDFSEGVLTSTPEPTTLSLSAAALLLGFAGVFRKRAR
ncbi:MAG TPA: hypothetical protein VGM43_03210 [Bryobacteraceae bacterium]|jgi:hypothetical protein